MYTEYNVVGNTAKVLLMSKMTKARKSFLVLCEFLGLALDV